jgi:hypothetical protein
MMLCKRRRDKMDVRDELGLDLCKGGKSGQVSSHSIDQVLKGKRRIGHTGDDSWRDEEELENGEETILQVCKVVANHPERETIEESGSDMESD